MIPIADIQPVMIADFKCHVGEGPLWHPDERKLYWVDIPQGRLFSYDPATGSSEMIYEDRPIGGYTLQEDGSLLCFRDKGNVVILDTHGTVVRTVIDEIPELVSTRFNDVIAAPDGSVFAGTMTSDEIAGRLYHVRTDGSYTVILENQGTPNGMGFTTDETVMYFQDSRAQTLSRFDHRDGELSNHTILRNGKEVDDPGRGDGMTVDANDDLWSARWDGSGLLHCDKEGIPQKLYPIPAHCVTSLTFGGSDYTDIYVTTAMGQKRPETGELAGALFTINVGISGKPEYRSLL